MKCNLIALSTALLILALSACGDAPSKQEPTDSPTGLPPTAAQGAAYKAGQDAPVPATAIAAPFEQADFKGKVRACVYAGNDRVMVLADDLNLYDVLSGQIIATAPISLTDIVVRPFEGGYFVAGMDDSGVIGYLYNETLSNVQTISFPDLIEADFIFSEYCVAVSDDGGTIAFAGFNGLYLYHPSSGARSTLVSFHENAEGNGMKLSMIETLAFTGTDELTFTGTGNSVPSPNEEDGFSIYGTIRTDGTLHMTKSASYTISELLTGGTRAVLPQSFDKNDGTLLTVDLTSGQPHTYRFSTKGEGNDGVFCSSDGTYFATAVLSDDLTVRIYDAQSGALCHTEVITHADDTYFLRIPQIVMLDRSRTCIVLLGRGISEVDTLITTFQYGGSQ